MRGLVLEGGGAKGSYQVGAYKALLELGYTFDYIVGTSIGAVNGAMFVQGDEKIAEKVWADIKYSTVVDADNQKLKSFMNEDLTLSNFMTKVGLIREVISEGGFDTTPFKNLLDSYIDEEKIRSSKIKFGLVTVDVTNRKPIEIFVDDMEKGELKNYLYGSSNLPVFKQEPIDGRYLIDGGFYANNPVEMLKGKCDEIVDILLYNKRTLRSSKYSKEVTVICPREKITDILNFTSESAIYGMKLGYFDTYRVFKGLLGDRYYIEDLGDEEAILILLDLYREIKNIEDGPETLRDFLENWIFKYIKKNNIDKSVSYSQLLAFMVERLANEKIDRFKIYSLRDLAREIKEKIDLDKSEYIIEEKLLTILTKSKPSQK